MFSSEHHRGSFDDDRRRLARVLPGTAVYRPLHCPLQSPPTNGVIPQADGDVTSGSRDDLAPPPAKMPRDLVDHLEPSPAAGRINRCQVTTGAAASILTFEIFSVYDVRIHIHGGPQKRGCLRLAATLANLNRFCIIFIGLIIRFNSK